MEISDWKFDNQVAKSFRDHAEQHIPHYRQVLSKTLSICNALADKNDPIVDFGCATGATLELLYNNHYSNLYGIDNSADMLSYCPQNIAALLCADTLPFDDEFFKVIVCNWTLHFVKDKETTLKLLVQKLKPTGALILSDKVSLDPLMIDLYHNVKRANGVTEQEIQEKAQRVKNIMFVNTVDWYLDQFKELGLTAHIIDADYAFASFLAVKN